MQHVHSAMAAQQQPAAPDSTGNLSTGLTSSSSSNACDSAHSVGSGAGGLLWRQFLNQGGSLADAVELVGWVAFLQEHADVAGGRDDGDNSSSSSSSVAGALQEQGMWPLGPVELAGVQQRVLRDGQDALDPLDVLAVCLSCALAQIRQVPA